MSSLKTILNKWTAYDISEDSGVDEEIFTIQYFIATGDKISGFYYVDEVEPKVIGFTNRVQKDLLIKESDYYIILLKEDHAHPLHSIPARKLNQAMLRSVFGEEAEIK